LSLLPIIKINAECYYLEHYFAYSGVIPWFLLGKLQTAVFRRINEIVSQKSACNSSLNLLLIFFWPALLRTIWYNFYIIRQLVFYCFIFSRVINYPASIFFYELVGAKFAVMSGKILENTCCYFYKFLHMIYDYECEINVWFFIQNFGHVGCITFHFIFSLFCESA
jgi:hypothetical protein